MTEDQKKMFLNLIAWVHDERCSIDDRQSLRLHGINPDELKNLHKAVKRIKPKTSSVNRKETEREMENKLEELRQESFINSTKIWAMSNGERIQPAANESIVRSYQKDGFWICSIFEDGVRVEA
jgi:hypothetical protein